MLYYEKIVNNENYEWVLFLHGIGGSIKTWKYQLEEYSKKFNLLLVDLDGHGKSKVKKTKKEEYLPYLSAKQINKILENENIAKVHIVSMSLGTLVALEFFNHFDSKVSSMILSGCIINLNIKRELLLDFVQSIKEYIPKSIMYNIFALVILPKENHKKSREIFIRESKKMNDFAFSKWMDAVSESKKHLYRYLNKINKKDIPILFISGKEDYFFYNGIKELNDKLKNFKMSIMKNCGHVCSIENPIKFNNLSISFLNNSQKRYIQLN